MYDTFGKPAVRFAYRYLRFRYKREIRIGIGIGAAGPRRRRVPGEPQRPRGLMRVWLRWVVGNGWGLARKFPCGLSATPEGLPRRPLASAISWCGLAQKEPSRGRGCCGASLRAATAVLTLAPHAGAVETEALEAKLAALAKKPARSPPSCAKSKAQLAAAESEAAEGRSARGSASPGCSPKAKSAPPS